MNRFDANEAQLPRVFIFEDDGAQRAIIAKRLDANDLVVLAQVKLSNFRLVNDCLDNWLVFASTLNDFFAHFHVDEHVAEGEQDITVKVVDHLVWSARDKLILFEALCNANLLEYSIIAYVSVLELAKIPHMLQIFLLALVRLYLVDGTVAHIHSVVNELAIASEAGLDAAILLVKLAVIFAVGVFGDHEVVYRCDIL